MYDTIRIGVETAEFDGLPKRKLGANYSNPKTGTVMQVEFDSVAGYLLVRVAMKDSATYALNLNEITNAVENLHAKKSRMKDLIFNG
jgi:hypothetical protein